MITINHDTQAIARRLGRLQASLRHWQRGRDLVASGGVYGEYAPGGRLASAVPEYLARAEVEITRLGEQIVQWRAELAALEANATCTCRVTIPSINAEFVPEQDGGPCTRPPAARLTNRHDGTSCGCNGLCLVTDPDQPDDQPADPWTEVILLCANHAHEYQPLITGHAGSPAVTYEELA